MRLAVLGLLLSLLSGCGAATQAFKDGAYENPLYGYRVAVDGGPSVGPKWKLDNYQLDSKGHPSKPKRNETTAVVLDLDGDGEFEKAGKHPDPDLRFINLGDDGKIWLRSVPASQDMAAKELRILISHWVSSLSGTGQLMVYDHSRSVAVSESQTYSSRITNEAEGKVSGYEAHFARVDLSSLEQLKLDPNHREAIYEIAVVRTDYVWSAGREAAFPVYLVLGYRNHPDYFEAGLDDFHRFLNQIDLISPPPVPEPVVKQCSLGTRALHAAVGVTGVGKITRLRLVEGDRAMEKCMLKALSSATFPKLPAGREQMLVHASPRGPVATNIPDLGQKSGATPGPSAANSEAADTSTTPSDDANPTTHSAERGAAEGTGPATAQPGEPEPTAPATTSDE